MTKVILSLGSNIGNRAAYLGQAVALLSKYISEIAVSSIIITKPMYVANQPNFYNQVISGNTDLPPQKFLEITQGIEQAIGRIKSYFYGPRCIDIDILYYGDQVIQEPDLIIPHPLIKERLFVLHPLAELEPTWVCPITHQSAEAMFQALLKIQPNTNKILKIPA
jgi:2-amino-4-hydroxy-6-hydroxymethyldihydropteridine diphosphokinase